MIDVTKSVFCFGFFVVSFSVPGLEFVVRLFVSACRIDMSQVSALWSPSEIRIRIQNFERDNPKSKTNLSLIPNRVKEKCYPTIANGSNLISERL